MESHERVCAYAELLKSQISLMYLIIYCRYDYERITADLQETEKSRVLYDKGKKKGKKVVSVFETAVEKRPGFMTNWGPIGYSKQLHPFSIMVI